MTADGDLDREAGYAAELLARAYREKGDADDEPWAAAFIAVLKARGWRPTLARAAADWRQQQGDGPGLPDPSGPGGADYLAFKAARGWAPVPPPAAGGGGP